MVKRPPFKSGKSEETACQMVLYPLDRPRVQFCKFPEHCENIYPYSDSIASRFWDGSSLKLTLQLVTIRKTPWKVLRGSEEVPKAVLRLLGSFLEVLRLKDGGSISLDIAGNYTGHPEALRVKPFMLIIGGQRAKTICLSGRQLGQLNVRQAPSLLDCPVPFRTVF